jgi:hypothetical protein
MASKQTLDRILENTKGLTNINNLQDISISMVHKHVEAENDRFEYLLETLKVHIEEEHKSRQDLEDKMDELIHTINPLVDVYNNSRGVYNSVTFIMKFAAILSAGVAAIIFLRKL